MRAGRKAASFPAADEDYFADMDGGYKRDGRSKREAQQARGGGPQYLDRVDRRQRPLLGLHGQQHLRRLRPAQDPVVQSEDRLLHRPEREALRPRIRTATSAKTSNIPRTAIWTKADLRREGAQVVHAQPQQPLLLVRPDQRALLRAGQGAGRIRALARRPQERLPVRSVRERQEISRREDRRARRQPMPVGSYYGKPAASSACGCSPTRISTRPPRRNGWTAIKENPNAFYTDKNFYNNKHLDPPLSRRHVVRLLSRRPGAEQSAGGSGKSRLGQPEFESGRAIFLGRPGLYLEPAEARRPISSSSSSTPRCPARSIPRSCRPTTSTIRAP